MGSDKICAETAFCVMVLVHFKSHFFLPVTEENDLFFIFSVNPGGRIKSVEGLYESLI